METLVVREAIKIVIKMNLVNVIVKSDFQVEILSITDKIITSKQISNLVDDISSIYRKEI